MAVIGLKYLAVAPLKTEVDGQLPTYVAGGGSTTLPILQMDGGEKTSTDKVAEQ